MPTGFRIEGVAAMKAKLQRLAQRVPEAATAALYARAELVMTRSKREFVPVDLGALRSTGHVEKPVRRGTVIRVTLAYGGPAVSYALAVHEHPSAHSPRSWRGTAVQFHPNGRGAKYLERPLFDVVPTLARDIADDIKLARLL